MHRRRNLQQAPEAAGMIRPHRFHPSPEKAGNNAFQRKADTGNDETALRARDEFDAAVAVLREQGVSVHALDDKASRDTPDSVFQNNWFSTHRGGHVVSFPTPAPNRRREHRSDVIELSGMDRRFLALPQAAFESLTPANHDKIGRYLPLVPRTCRPLNLPEVRCVA